MEKKKKNYSEGNWMGYCPFACVESRYNGVYRDTGPGGATQRAAGAQGTKPRYDRDRPRHGRMGTLSAMRAAARVRTWPGHGESRYKTLYRG